MPSEIVTDPRERNRNNDNIFKRQIPIESAGQRAAGSGNRAQIFAIIFCNLFHSCSS